MSTQNQSPELIDSLLDEPTNGTVVVSSVQFPIQVFNEAGRMNAGIRLINALGQEFDAAQIQVILKNAGEIIAHALEMNKEDCLVKLTQKETMIFGAKVTTRRSTEYDYSETPLVATTEAEIDRFKKKLTGLKDMLKALPLPEVVDSATGEIFHKAKLVKDGIIPAISLPK